MLGAGDAFEDLACAVIENVALCYAFRAGGANDGVWFPQGRWREAVDPRPLCSSPPV